MKKLFVVFVFGVFASCGNGSGNEAYTTQDSLATADSMNANNTTVDSAASAQKSSIDSMQRGAAMDSAGAKKDVKK